MCNSNAERLADASLHQMTTSKWTMATYSMQLWLKTHSHLATGKMPSQL
jgi:hypothetical protein